MILPPPTLLDPSSPSCPPKLHILSLKPNPKNAHQTTVRQKPL